MSNDEYEYLWHYSEQFTRDKLQRSELVTMAYVQGQKLGARCTPGLMKSVMHFRAKELDRRSAFPADEMGKSTQDVWNKPERVYLDRPIERGESLAEFLLPMKVTPLDFTIANQFLGSLSEQEADVLNDLSAGYSHEEIRKRHVINNPEFQALRRSLQHKATAQLV